MRPEDRTVFCPSCKLEYPYGMLNDNGRCDECEQLRPMQRFTRTHIRPIKVVRKAKWTKTDWILLAVMIVATLIVCRLILLTAILN